MIVLNYATEEAASVNPEEVLSRYSLTQEVAAQYIEAITRMNQTEAAETLGVSRDTINRYKNAFAEMQPRERLLLISTLTQNQLLAEAAGQDKEDTD